MLLLPLNVKVCAQTINMLDLNITTGGVTFSQTIDGVLTSPQPNDYYLRTDAIISTEVVTFSTSGSLA